jgi:phage terminase large subunit-like protein
MVEHGSVYDEYPGLDPGLTRVNYESGGSIISTTSAASSKDGGKDTFNVFDETHLWMTPKLKALHATVTRNLVKRKIADGWALETSTMYCPGEESVAEETHKSAAQLPGVLFDHKEAPLDIDIKDDDQLRKAIEYVYGPAAVWTNVDAIVEEFRDPTKRESECRRYWLNQPWSMEEKFLLPSEWDACSIDSAQIPDGARVVLGFDGSRSDDSTALVAVSYGDGNPVVQVAGLWEKPEGPTGEDWRVPRLRVMETIRECCRRWQVLECTADPAWWAQTLEELADEGIPVTEFPQTGLRMIPATKRLYDLVQCQGLTHDGDLRLRKHVLNAVVRPEERGFRLFKDKKASEHKIDLAVATVMALERAAAHEEIEPPTVWSIREVMEQMQADGEVPQDGQDDEVLPGPAGVRLVRF